MNAEWMTYWASLTNAEALALSLAMMLWIALQIGLGWLLADFASGVFHWAEDRYGSPRWPFFGGAIRDTIRHHRRPTGMLKKTIWARSWRVFLIAAIGFSVIVTFGWLSVFTITIVIGAGLADEIHGAAHRSPDQNGRLVTWLQTRGIIQSHAHHAAHHRGLKNKNYCTITNWLNPVLERIRFWRRVEALIKTCANQRPRRDPVVRRRQRRRWHKPRVSTSGC